MSASFQPDTTETKEQSSNGRFFYAVHEGRQRGIYLSWRAAQPQVFGYPNAIHKKFSTLVEAKRWLKKQAEQEVIVIRYHVIRGHRPGFYRSPEEALMAVDDYAGAYARKELHRLALDGQMIPVAIPRGHDPNEAIKVFPDPPSRSPNTEAPEDTVSSSPTSPPHHKYHLGLPQDQRRRLSSESDWQQQHGLINELPEEEWDPESDAADEAARQVDVPAADVADKDQQLSDMEPMNLTVATPPKRMHKPIILQLSSEDDGHSNDSDFEQDGRIAAADMLPPRTPQKQKSPTLHSATTPSTHANTETASSLRPPSPMPLSNHRRSLSYAGFISRPPPSSRGCQTDGY